MRSDERQINVAERLSALASSVVPSTKTHETAALIAALQPAVRANRQAALSEAIGIVTASPATDHGWFGAGWIRLARAQVSLLRPAFWLATLIIGVVGATALRATGSSLFVLIAPVLAAIGVAVAFRPALTGTWEIELACPVRPFEWLMARFGVVVAYDLLLLGVLTPLLATGGDATFVVSLFLAWLGPLLLLAGLALQASLRWGVGAGVTVPLLVWGGLYGLLRQVTPHSRAAMPPVTELTQPAALVIWGIALVVGIGLIAATPRTAAGWGGITGEA